MLNFIKQVFFATLLFTLWIFLNLVSIGIVMHEDKLGLIFATAVSLSQGVLGGSIQVLFYLARNRFSAFDISDKQGAFLGLLIGVLTWLLWSDILHRGKIYIPTSLFEAGAIAYLLITGSFFGWLITKFSNYCTSFKNLKR